MITIQNDGTAKIIHPEEVLAEFFERSKDDPRIGCTHQSLFLTLYFCWHTKKLETPLCFFRSEITSQGKFSVPTYHRTIRQLAEYGYLKYIPSYNHFLGSLVYFHGGG